MIARPRTEPAPPPSRSPSPSPSLTEQVIEDLVYEHLLDLIKLERLAQLEQVVAEKLEDLAAFSRPAPDATSTRADEDDEDDDADADCPAIIAVSSDALTRAAHLVERAWHRVLADPRRYLDFRATWQADDDCALCRALAESGA